MTAVPTTVRTTDPRPIDSPFVDPRKRRQGMSAAASIDTMNRCALLFLAPLIVACGGKTKSQAATSDDRQFRTGCYTMTVVPRRNGELHQPVVLDRRGRVLVQTLVGNEEEAGLFPKSAFIWDGARHDLAPIDDRPFLAVRDMNDRGEVVGMQTDHTDGDFVWDLLWRDGVPQRLSLPASLGNPMARIINGGGDVAGSYDKGGFIWHPDGTVDLLERSSAVFDMNDARAVVGHFEDRRAVIWRSGTRTDLGFDGLPWSMHLNETGSIAGNDSASAFFWSKGALTELGKLAGANLHVTDINDRGDVVGFAGGREFGGGAPPMHAFMWTAGKLVDLGPTAEIRVSGFQRHEMHINARGQIVGFSTGDASDRPLVWESGTKTTLPTPGIATDVPVHATLINDAGVVAGFDRSHTVLIWRPDQCPGGADAGSPPDSGPPPEEPTE